MPLQLTHLDRDDRRSFTNNLGVTWHIVDLPSHAAPDMRFETIQQSARQPISNPSLGTEGQLVSGLCLGTARRPMLSLYPGAGGQSVLNLRLGAADKPNYERGLCIALDGSQVLRRMGYLIERGELDPKELPVVLGVDVPCPSRDLSPWEAPSAKGMPFAGGADNFWSIVEDAVFFYQMHADKLARAISGPLSLFGYSLAGLFALYVSARTDIHTNGSSSSTPHRLTPDRLLLASPSVWFSDLIPWLETQVVSPVYSNPQVLVAYGTREGLNKPEPLRSMQTRMTQMAALTQAQIFADNLDHHDGVLSRIARLFSA